jgi:SET domain-containing protein
MCDLSSKYGTKQRGLVTLEPIRRGEAIYECNPVTCTYYPENDSRNKFTRQQVLKLMEDHPEACDYIRDYALMIDDDLFEVPRYLDTKSITDQCALFNHSCEPNCDYDSSNGKWALIARRDIDEGEELTYHYGCFEIEDSLIAGMKCNCGTASCQGQLNFDFWRNKDCQLRFENVSSAFIQRKIHQLNESDN